MKFPQFIFAIGRFVAGSAIFIVCFSCSQDEGLEGYPPPGHMRVVSVTRIDDGPVSDDFVRLGYEEWYPGAPRPTGPFLGPPKHIKLSPKISEMATGDVSLAVKWSKPDSRWSTERRFGMVFDTLRKNTEYEVALTAEGDGSMPLYLEVHAQNQDDAETFSVPVAVPAVKLELAGERKEFKGVFVTGVADSYALTIVCFGSIPSDGLTAVLGDVRLRPMREVDYRTEIVATEENLIPNGSFEYWPPGEHLPLGPWSATEKDYKIETHMRRAKHGVRCVHQTWGGNANVKLPVDEFGVDVVGLKRETEYIFTCYADSLKTTAASIHVFGRDEAGALKKLKSPIVTIRPQKSGFVLHEGRFTTGGYTEVRIVSAISPESGKGEKRRILWDDWRLVAAP